MTTVFGQLVTMVSSKLRHLSFSVDRHDQYNIDEEEWVCHACIRTFQAPCTQVSCFILFRRAMILVDFIRILGQSDDCPSASEATLKNIDKWSIEFCQELAMQLQQKKAKRSHAQLLPVDCYARLFHKPVDPDPCPPSLTQPQIWACFWRLSVWKNNNTKHHNKHFKDITLASALVGNGLFPSSSSSLVSGCPPAEIWRKANCAYCCKLHKIQVYKQNKNKKLLCTGIRKLFNRCNCKKSKTN